MGTPEFFTGLIPTAAMPVVSLVPPVPNFTSLEVFLVHYSGFMLFPWYAMQMVP